MYLAKFFIAANLELHVVAELPLFSTNHFIQLFTTLGDKLSGVSSVTPDNSRYSRNIFNALLYVLRVAVLLILSLGKYVVTQS
jgi:hypothetical protein